MSVDNPDKEMKDERRRTIMTWAISAVIASLLGWIVYTQGFRGFAAVIIKTIMGGD